MEPATTGALATRGRSMVAVVAQPIRTNATTSTARDMRGSFIGSRAARTCDYSHGVNVLDGTEKLMAGELIVYEPASSGGIEQKTRAMGCRGPNGGPKSD